MTDVLKGYNNEENEENMVVKARAAEGQKMDADAYYEEVSVERHHHTLGTYFLVKVPKYDKDGNLIKIKRGFANDKTSGHLETPRSFAKRKSATMVMNCSTFSDNTKMQVGTSIYNGQIIQEKNKEVYNYILGIKDDNTMKAFLPTTGALTILAQGYTNALTGFIPMIENGAIVDNSVFNTREMFGKRHPRQAISQDSAGNTYVFTTEGRRLDENGWTAKECAQVLYDLDMKFAYMMDGGGSTQTVYNAMLVNRITDDIGREERPIVDFLYVGKDMETTMNASEALNPAGDVMKIVNDQIAEIEEDIKALRAGGTGYVFGTDNDIMMSDYFSSYGSNYGSSGAGLPRLWTTPSKEVHWIGVVKVSSLGKVFMNLPAELAPSITQEFLTMGYNTNNSLYRIKVTSAGEVSASLVSGSATSHSVNLNGIRYLNY